MVDCEHIWHFTVNNGERKSKKVQQAEPVQLGLPSGSRQDSQSDEGQQKLLPETSTGSFSSDSGQPVW